MQILNSNDSNVKNIKIYAEKNLSKLSNAGNSSKKFTTTEKDEVIWLLQCNNLDLLCSFFLDVNRNCNPSNFYDGNSKKHIQPVKKDKIMKTMHKESHELSY